LKEIFCKSWPEERMKWTLNFEELSAAVLLYCPWCDIFPAHTAHSTGEVTTEHCLHIPRFVEPAGSQAMIAVILRKSIGLVADQ
jgi:hypothetical protein